MGPQQLRSLLDARDEATTRDADSPTRAHTRRRTAAPIPPWEEWDDGGPHFAPDLKTDADDRGDVSTIAMRRFRGPVASTMNPTQRPTEGRPRTPSGRDDIQTAVAQPAPRNPRPSNPVPLHRHGVVTMPPLSALESAEGSSDQLRPPAAPRRSRTTPALLPSVAPAPSSAAYSYQPHLARIERVADEEDARPPRLARSSEPEAARGNDDWVVLVTHRTHTEAIEPSDIVDTRDTAVQTARINDIARLVAEADAQAAAAEAAAAASTQRFAEASAPNVAAASAPNVAAASMPNVAAASAPRFAEASTGAPDEADFSALDDADFSALGAPNFAPASARSFTSTADSISASAADPAFASATDPAFASATDPAFASAAEPNFASATDPSFASATDPSFASATDPSFASAADLDFIIPDDTDFTIPLEPSFTASSAPAFSPGNSVPVVPATDAVDAAPFAPASAATSGPHDPNESRGIAPEGTRSLEIPILYPEPADAAHLEPSIIVAAEVAPAPAPAPRLARTDHAMWPLDAEDEPLPPAAEQVLATALRDLVALDAAMARGPAGAIMVHPAHRSVRPRHVLFSLGVVALILVTLYAVASAIF